MKKHTCPICGYVHRGEKPPAFCPQCKCSGKKFEASESADDMIDDILVDSARNVNPSAIMLDEPEPTDTPAVSATLATPEVSAVSATLATPEVSEHAKQPKSHVPAEERRIRHCEKEKLFALLMAQSNPESIPALIAQTRAKMEKEDIADVVREFEAWQKSRKPR